MAILNYGGNFVNKTGDTMTGQLLQANGTVGAPSYAFSAKPDTGFLYNAGVNCFVFSFAGVARLSLAALLVGDLEFPAAGRLVWSQTTDPTAAGDTAIQRDAANIIAQRYLTNPQSYRVYNTFTDSSNYERFGINWASNLLTLVNEAAGTGTLRVFNLGASAKGNVGQIFVDYTNTATVGNVTINKASGRVNMAALGATFTVTNSLVTAASHIFLNADGAPGNAVAVQLYAVPAAGSFTVNAVPAVTNQTAIDFFVVNAD